MSRPSSPPPPITRLRTSQSDSGLLEFDLFVLSGPRKGKSVRITSAVHVGKAQDNELVLDDDTVSRKHARFSLEPGGVLVEDLGSTNGVRILGTQIHRALVSPGTIVTLGDVELLVKVPEFRGSLPSERESFGDFVSKQPSIRIVFSILETVAATNATVLIEGETGTGKDLLARAIHQESAVAQGPFVVLDCGAVSYSLIESELFGHEKGAFTGATSTRPGALELARGGTLFLDEIGELPLEVQPKLLRALETKEFRRVGGSKSLSTDARFIAATKRDLQREVSGGRFREDLYYRLAVVPVHLPPLRERLADIPLLLERFWGGQVPADLVSFASANEWTGNVRELRNFIERAKLVGLTAASSPSLSPRHRESKQPSSFDPTKSYRETRAEVENAFESAYVRWLLGRNQGNITQAAKEAKMDRKYLAELIKKHGIDT